MTDTLGNQLNLSLGLLLPELILAATALVVVFVDMFQKELKAGHGVLPVLALIGLVAAAVATGTDIDKHDSFARMVSIDNFTAFFRFLFIGVAIVLIVGSHEYIERHVNHIGEFYGLLLLSTAGAIFMAGGSDLLIAYLGVEVLSFSLYIAVSLGKNDPRSGEAGLKYVLLGGVASAMLLYGLSLLYGVAGSTQYADIAGALSIDRKSTRLNSSHSQQSRMPSSA